MTTNQAKILSRFIRQVAELAAETLTAFAENEKHSNQVSSSLPPTSENRLLNREEIAERLGVCVRTVADLIDEGMPIIPLGERRIQFDWDEVLTWLKNRRLKDSGKSKLRVVS